MIEVLPGIYDTTSKLFPTRKFKWQSYGSRRRGVTGRSIRYEGFATLRKSEIVYQDGIYAIIKNFSYSYRSGQTSAAHTLYVPTSFDLVRVDEGHIQFSGTLTILMTLECGHQWRKGVEYLKLIVQDELQLKLNLD